MKIEGIVKLQLPVQLPWKCVPSVETLLLFSLLALTEGLWHLPDLWCFQCSKQYAEQIKIYIHTIKNKMDKVFLWYLFCLLHLFQLNTKKTLCWGDGMGWRFQGSNMHIHPCHREHETMHRLKLSACDFIDLKSIPFFHFLILFRHSSVSYIQSITQDSKETE